MTYKIFIQTDSGTLVYKKVKRYVEEGSFIKFIDQKTGQTLLYPILKAQIQVEED